MSEKHGSEDMAESDKLSNTKELLTYLGDENRKNREALRDDAEANRKLLGDSIKWVSVPLSLLITIAGFLGWNSLEQIKKQGTAFYVEAQTNESKAVQERLDKEFAKDNIQKTIQVAVQKSPFVSKTIDEKLLLEKDAIDRKAASEVAGTAQAAVNRQMNEQKHVIDEEVQKDSWDLLKAYQEAAKKISEARPRVRVTGGSAVTNKGSIALIATFENTGRFDAKHLTSYSTATVLPTARGDQALKDVFIGLAHKIADMRSDKKGEHSKDLGWGREIDFSARSDISSFDESRLEEDNAELYFMFFVEYEDSAGYQYYTPYCGSTAGNLERIITCPSENYTDIVLGR